MWWLEETSALSAATPSQSAEWAAVDGQQDIALCVVCETWYVNDRDDYVMWSNENISAAFINKTAHNDNDIDDNGDNAKHQTKT